MVVMPQIKLLLQHVDYVVTVTSCLLLCTTKNTHKPPNMWQGWLSIDEPLQAGSHLPSSLEPARKLEESLPGSNCVRSKRRAGTGTPKVLQLTSGDDSRPSCSTTCTRSSTSAGSSTTSSAATGGG